MNKKMEKNHSHFLATITCPSMGAANDAFL